MNNSIVKYDLETNPNFKMFQMLVLINPKKPRKIIESTII